MTRTRQPEDTDAFSEFWCEYPRPVGKGHARKAYAWAVKRATPAEILLGVRAYQFSSDIQYQPHPATWLRGERWLRDNPSAPATVGGPARSPTLDDTLRGIMGGAHE